MGPGLVGKGPGSEPFIDLDSMLDLTAAAEVDGVRFDGVQPPAGRGVPGRSSDGVYDETWISVVGNP
jgi:hypothetical protein